jgi:hypothetical protein
MKDQPQPTDWIDPRSGEPAAARTILPCLESIRAGRVMYVPDGFGWHWEKIYQTRLEGATVSPEGVIEVWKNEFARFWPKGNLFFAPARGVQPGEIGLLKLAIPGQTFPFMSTGVFVDEVTPTSFTYSALAGHPIAGSMTFSAHRVEGVTVAQAHASLRASDPLFEISIRLFGKKEDQFWKETLANVARRFGAQPEFSLDVRLVDRTTRWRNAGNVRWNAGLFSILYTLTFPFRYAAWARKNQNRS